MKNILLCNTYTCGNSIEKNKEWQMQNFRHSYHLGWEGKAIREEYPGASN